MNTPGDTYTSQCEVNNNKFPIFFSFIMSFLIPCSMQVLH